MPFPANSCLFLCNSFSVWWCGNFLLLWTLWKRPNLIAKWNAIHLVKRAIYRLFWKMIFYNKSDYSHKKKRMKILVKRLIQMKYFILALMGHWPKWKSCSVHILKVGLMIFAVKTDMGYGSRTHINTLTSTLAWKLEEGGCH